MLQTFGLSQSANLAALKVKFACLASFLGGLRYNFVVGTADDGSQFPRPSAHLGATVGEVPNQLGAAAGVARLFSCGDALATSLTWGFCMQFRWLTLMIASSHS